MSKKAKKSGKTQHPEMMEVEVIFTNGEKLKIKMASSYGREVLHLQSDILTHRAWQDRNQPRQEVRGTRAQKLASRFPKLDI